MLPSFSSLLLGLADGARRGASGSGIIRLLRCRIGRDRLALGRFQLSTDGFTPYRTAVTLVFGDTIDNGLVVKTYANTPEGGRPAATRRGEVIEMRRTVYIGTPDINPISASISERANLSIRMAMRRMTRLTNAHSCKWENHRAAFAL